LCNSVFRPALDSPPSSLPSLSLARQIPPGALTKPVYRETGNALKARTSARSSQSRFPLKFASQISAVETKTANSYHLVRKLGPTRFIVKKHASGREFNVFVGPERFCDCAECELKESDKKKATTTKSNDIYSQRICGVTLFVLLKVLLVPRESPLLFKKVWSGPETDAVIRAANQQGTKIHSQNIFSPLTPSASSSLYDNEYDEKYGYDKWSSNEEKVMGGTFRLELPRREKAFTVKDMRLQIAANGASYLASYTESRGDGVGAMKSLNDMALDQQQHRPKVFTKFKSGGNNGEVVEDDDSFVTAFPSLPSFGNRWSSPVKLDRSSPLLSVRSEDAGGSPAANRQLQNQPLVYPFFILGGKKVVAQGVVLPPGMKIRHPSLLFSTNFVHTIKEFLYIWETTRDAVGREMLSNNIRNLWVYNSIFHIWARNVHDRNEARTEALKLARIRLTVMLLGTKVDICVSPLVNGTSVMALAVKKRRSVSKNVRKQSQGMVLSFQGVIIDDKRTLLDALVVDRSTLQMTFAYNE
jgi:hypothetical protein